MPVAAHFGVTDLDIMGYRSFSFSWRVFKAGSFTPGHLQLQYTIENFKHRLYCYLLVSSMH